LSCFDKLAAALHDAIKQMTTVLYLTFHYARLVILFDVSVTSSTATGHVVCQLRHQCWYNSTPIRAEATPGRVGLSLGRSQMMPVTDAAVDRGASIFIYLIWFAMSQSLK